MSETVEQGGIMKYENIQFFFRKHWTHFLKILIFNLTLSLIVIFSLLIIGTIITVFHITVFYPFFAFLVIILSLFVINTSVLQLFNFFFSVVIVTNNRIIIASKTVFLKNDNDAIDLTKIQDIGVVAHGILKNYLNYGSLIISLSTATPPIEIPCAPNPHYYLEQMNRVKRENILERQERRNITAQTQNQAKTLDYLRDIDKLEHSS
jgi:hypothetical protein